MVQVQSPSHARAGSKVDLVILNKGEDLSEVCARYSSGEVPFRLVRGRDGFRRIRFTMPAVEEVMFRLRGRTDGPRLVRVRLQH